MKKCNKTPTKDQKEDKNQIPRGKYIIRTDIILKRLTEKRRKSGVQTRLIERWDLYIEGVLKQLVQMGSDQIFYRIEEVLILN